ncbi:MAG: putative ferredoxin, 2Fe-2S, partial [Verrucomicrobiales bacterium]|nr:putative ferredoxin, 2Fe-2S [Verrucomicrobiales bacterium]
MEIGCFCIRQGCAGRASGVGWMMENSAELEGMKRALGLEEFRRHIFLCADAAEAKCCGREEGLRAWEFLKSRLKELGLAGPRPRVFRTKAGCLRVCVEGPVAVVYPEG